MDELETKLHPYRVEMFRRPGVGVWLQGDASSYRRVVSALLRSSLPEKELADVLCGRMPENDIFSTLLDTKTAEKVWKVLQQFEQEEQLHLPDAGFLALAIHCTLTIQQLQQGGDKGSAPRGLRPAGNHAARLVAALNRTFGLTLPPEEAQYLELYLAAYLGAEDPWGSAQEMELWNLEAALIREMKKALHTDLSGYTSLRDDLYCHLRSMLLRVEQKIHTEPPSWTPSAPPIPACGRLPALPVMRCSSNSSCPPSRTMKRPTLPCTLVRCWNRMPCFGCGCGW